MSMRHVRRLEEAREREQEVGVEPSHRRGRTRSRWRRWQAGIGVGCAISFNTGVEGQLPIATTEPIRRYGALDGPGALSQAFSVEVLPSGGLVVSEPQIPGFVVFDSTGRFTRVVGRRGEGPGEYTTIGALGWIGDTLYALDVGRLHLYNRNAGYLLTRRTAVQWTLSEEIAYLLPGPPAAGGHVLGLATLTSEAAARQDATVPLLLLGRDGNLVREVVRLRAGKRTLTVRSRSGPPVRSFSNPWADDDLWTLSKDGETIIVVQRTVPAERVRSAEYRVTRLNLQGDTLFSRAHSYVPSAVADADYAAALKRITDFLAQGSSGNRSLIESDVRGVLRSPLYHVPVTAVLAGRDETIWIRRDTVGSSAQWEVHSSRGVPVGRILLPAGMRVVQADRSHVWGVVRDSYDVPYVQLLAVRWP